MLNKKSIKYLHMKPLLFVVFAALLLNSCSSGVEHIKPLINSGNLPDITITNFESNYTTNQRKKAHMIAPLANQYSSTDDPRVECPRGFVVTFYNDMEQEESKLTANFGIYHQRQNLWVARGNVVLRNSDGGILTTEELFGDENTKKIYTKKFVQIIQADSTVVRGKNGFESNFSFTAYKFINVDGVVNYREDARLDTIQKQ